MSMHPSSSALHFATSSGPVPDQFQFDHVYPSLGAVQPQVVVALYGQLGSPEFAVLHDTLASMATEGRIRYIFRHYTKVMVVVDVCGCICEMCVLCVVCVHCEVCICEAVFLRCVHVFVRCVCVCVCVDVFVRCV